MDITNGNAAKVSDVGSSFDEAIKKGKWKALASAYLGWLFDCWDLMVLSLAVPLLIDAFHLSLSEAGLLSSATLVGAALGAYAWGPISDKFGRKRALASCLIAFGVLTVFSIFAQTYNHLLLLRIFTGFALGGEWALGATMVSEFFEAEHRGKVNSLVQSAWPLGFFCVLGIQYYFVPTYGWRALFVSGVVTVVGGLWIAISQTSPQCG